jgi:hypothetical protein
MLHVFDFEERDTNPGRVPRFWYRAQDSHDRPRDGFPPWNLAQLVYTSDRDGTSGVRPFDALPALTNRGIGSLALPTKGGSTSLLLDAGAIPVFPDTDYSISVQVRSNHLRFAKAGLLVRVLGADGKPIEGSQKVSELVTAEDGWRELSVRVATNQTAAAFLQVELVVLQPRQVRAMFPGPQRAIDAFEISEEDLDATAWFDDLTVLQLPRVSLRAPKGLESNVARAAQPPEFDVVVRDLANEQLTLELDALDADGRATPAQRHTLGQGTANMKWRPSLPARGWYRLRMRLLTASGQPVGGTFTDFVWLPEQTDALAQALSQPGEGPTNTSTSRDGANAAPPPRARQQEPEDSTSTRGLAGTGSAGVPRGMNDWRRFTISLDDAPTRHLLAMPSMLEQAGLNVVSLPLWTRALTEKDVAAHTRAMQLLVRQLVGEYVDVSITMPRLPDTLAERANIDPTDVAAVFSRPPAEWMPFAQEPLEKIGALTGRWQVGVSREDAGFIPSPSLTDLAAVRAGVGRFVPGLTLAVPTSIAQDWNIASLSRAAGPTRLLVHVPRDMGVESLRTLSAHRMTQFAQSAVASRRLASADAQSGAQSSPPPSVRDLALQWQLHPDVRDDLASPRDRAARITQSLVELWRLMGDQIQGEGATGMSTSLVPMSIALTNPWRLPEGEREQARPTPELAAFLFARDVLADARVLGEFPAADGLTCYILAPRTQGSEDTRGWLIAWNESCDPAQAFVDMPVGTQGVEIVDLFGNARTLKGTIGPDGVSRTVRIPVSQHPVFVRGVDVALAQFLASVRIDPPMLDAAAELGEHTITIRNPWPQSIAGKISILEPGGFDTGERDRSWRINPRTFSFSLGAGSSRQFDFTAAFRATEEAGPKRFLLGIDVSEDLPYGVLRVERDLELGLENFRIDTAYSIRSGDVMVECLVTNTSSKPMTLEVTALAPGLPRSRATIPDLAPGAQAIRRFTYPGSAHNSQPTNGQPSKVEGGLLGKRVVFMVQDAESGDRLSRSVAIE